MDRYVIQQRLAETEEQIANGDNQIAQQRRLIAELETRTLMQRRLVTLHLTEFHRPAGSHCPIRMAVVGEIPPPVTGRLHVLVFSL
jgi:hypothetical protein